MTVIFLLFKAYQPGLFDSQVEVAGHVTKRGTVVAPYRSTRKKRPEPPQAPDLFAEADRRAMEEDRKKAEEEARKERERQEREAEAAKKEADRKAQEEAEKEAKKVKPAKENLPPPRALKFKTKPVSEQYDADAQKGVFVIGEKEALRGAFIDAGIRLIYNKKEKAAFVSQKDLKKLDAMLNGDQIAASSDGPPPLSAAMDLSDLVARGKAVVERVSPRFHDAIQQAKAREEKALAAYHAIMDSKPTNMPEIESRWTAYTAARKESIKPWADLRGDIQRAVERRYDKETQRKWIDRIHFDVKGGGQEDDSAAAKKELAAAVAMFGPCPRVQSVVRSEKRAHYKGAEKGIDIGRMRKELREVMFHEYAHGLEVSDRRVLAAALTFRSAKATNNVAAHIQGHGPNEFGLPGNYIHPYAGKIYKGDNGTEIISMGAERFADAKTMAEFHKRDPDHFYLIMAINTAIDPESKIATKSYLFFKAAA